MSSLLRHDEDTFVAVVGAMDTDDRRNLLDARGSENLMRQALQLDRPRALLALRNNGASSSDYADSALKRYVRNNQAPALSMDLYRRGSLSRAEVVTALRKASVDALMTVAEQDVENRPLVRDAVLGNAANMQPDTLRRLLRLGILDDASYCEAMVPNPRASDRMGALIEDQALGLVAPAAVLGRLKPSLEAALQWVFDGLLSGEALLGHFDGIGAAEIRALYALQHIDAAAYFASGQATMQDVLEGIDQGTLSATDAVQRYTLPGPTIERLYTFDVIDRDAYAQRWEHGLMLPKGYVAHASAAELNNALRAVPMPRDAAAKRSLRLRLCAERIESLELQEVTRKPERAEPRLGAAESSRTGTWRRLRGAFKTPEVKAVTPRPSIERSSAEDACMACWEPFTPEAPAVKLEGCKHPPELHAACTRQAVQARVDDALPPVCPSEGCEHTVSMADGYTLGLGADLLDAVATARIRGFRPMHFRPCNTTGCVGGIPVPPGQRHILNCAHCDGETVIDTLTATERRLRDVLIPLIEGMDSDGYNVARSCYHCGAAAIRTAGCTAMVCGRDSDGHGRIYSGCGRSWDFVTGAGHSNARSGAKQQFVPKAGEMVEAGLYAPLRPGFVLSLSNRRDLPPGVSTIGELVIRNALSKNLIRYDNASRGYVLAG